MTNVMNNTNPVDMNSHISVALASIFDRALHNEPTRSLASCENVLNTIQFLDGQRYNTTTLQRFKHQGLIHKLRDCQLMEKKVSAYNLKDTTPKGFLELIKDRKDIGLDAIMQKKEENRDELQAIIANSDKKIAPEKVQRFTKLLEQVIATHENYLFVEDTQGFFCEEVLTAYRAHLAKLYSDNFFKDRSLDKAKVFTVEGVI